MSAPIEPALSVGKEIIHGEHPKIAQRHQTRKVYDVDNPVKLHILRLSINKHPYYIQNADKLAEIFDRLKYPYVKGKNWTTDAIYMETVDKAEARRKDGCISVDMEASGLQAMCNYYGYELYTFFFGADLLEGDSWDKASLGNEQEYDLQKKTFDVALSIAANI